MFGKDTITDSWASGRLREAAATGGDAWVARFATGQRHMKGGAVRAGESTQQHKIIEARRGLSDNVRELKRKPRSVNQYGTKRNDAFQQVAHFFCRSISMPLDKPERKQASAIQRGPIQNNGV